MRVDNPARDYLATEGMEVASQPQPVASLWSNMKEDNYQQGEGPLYYSLFKVLKFEPSQPL